MDHVLFLRISINDRYTNAFASNWRALCEIQMWRDLPRKDREQNDIKAAVVVRAAHRKLMPQVQQFLDPIRTMPPISVQYW